MGKTLSLRPRASKHLEAAKAQLARNTEQGISYACLDLRMAIECLTYDLLALYRDDVLDETLEEWRADKIIAALKVIDPASDAGPILQIANAAGEFEDADSIKFEEHRFETKWAKKAYNTLGRHLHERTFIELEQGQANDWLKVRERATAIATELEAVLGSSGWGLTMKRPMTVPCDCGQSAAFKMGPLQLRSRARCSKCDANYEIWREHHEAATVFAKLIVPAA